MNPTILPGLKVFAVTVTYGNRSQFVERLIERLIAINVHKVIVVDNGSSVDNKTQLKRVVSAYPTQVEIVSFSENYGSAGGFKQGLLAAERYPDCNFIWILDDDNLPDVKALEYLLNEYKTLKENCCLVSLRKNRILYRKIFNAKDVKRKFNPYNSFINYSLLHWFRKKFLYSKKVQQRISIPYAPYGGMFFHKNLIKTIGYPMEEMYLYRDDHEYSHRIVKAGLNIYLIRESTIEDMEVSWHGKKKYRFFSRFMIAIDGDEKKAYYLIRNSIYFERKYYISNRLEYAVNEFLYKLIFYSLCILYRKTDRIALFKKAYADSSKLDQNN